MNEYIDSLGEAQVFLTFDANSAYWKIEMNPGGVDRTAFVTHHRLLRYTRIPFVSKNAQTTFQRAMDAILASLKWQFAIVYIDDIIVSQRLPQQHLEHTEKVLRLTKEAGMTI